MFKHELLLILIHATLQFFIETWKILLKKIK